MLGGTERGGWLNDGGRSKDRNAVRTAARPPSSARARASLSRAIGRCASD